MKCSVPFSQSLVHIQQIVTGRESDRKKSPKERDDRATITERLELKFRNLCTRVSVTGTMRGVARACWHGGPHTTYPHRHPYHSLRRVSLPANTDRKTYTVGSNIGVESKRTYPPACSDEWRNGWRGTLCIHKTSEGGEWLKWFLTYIIKAPIHSIACYYCGNLIYCFMISVNRWRLYLAPQNIPYAVTLTLGNKVVLLGSFLLHFHVIVGCC